jgi:hypothetical protein
MVKRIKISCKGTSTCKIDQLKNFQGELKRLPKKQKEQLKKSIIKHGFKVPVFVWKKNILDGHQRLKVVSELVEEGWVINDKIPVVSIPAKNKNEAKEILLQISASYGQITNDGLEEFIGDTDMSLEQLQNDLSLPGINWSEFGVEDNTQSPEIEFSEELLESHNYIVLYFDNEVDWMSAKDKLGIKTKHSLDSKKGYERKGIGRVIKGVDVIEKIN